MLKLILKIASLFFLCSIFLILPDASSEMQDNYRKWPTCLGEFCFENELPKASCLEKNYGLGKWRRNDEETNYCYHASDQKLFVKIWAHNDIPPFIIGILVSDMPSCNKSKGPIKPFKKLKTIEGLAINDLYEKVIKVYGKPLLIKEGVGLEELQNEYFTDLHKEARFDMALGYGPNRENDLLFSWIFLKEGKVKAILIGRFE